MKEVLHWPSRPQFVPILYPYREYYLTHSRVTFYESIYQNHYANKRESCKHSLERKPLNANTACFYPYSSHSRNTSLPESEAIHNNPSMLLRRYH